MLMKIEGFYGKLDEKPNLIGFENGVYDLDAFEFRDGRPEDMLTKSTGYNYTDNVNDEVRDDLMKFFRSIQPNEEMTEGLLMTQAINLHGTKRHELIFFWCGRGGNGKGVSVVVIEGTFGEYFYAPSVQLYTARKKSSSQAAPELAKARGVRNMISTEPEQDEIIQIGLIKQLTGGDKTQARELYGKPIEFVLQALPVIQMNNRPKLSGVDGGIARRLVVVDFPFNFVENPVLEHERPIDNTLKEKFKKTEYHQQFFLMLLERYKTYANNGFKMTLPAEMLEAAKEYLDENNLVKKCLIENYQKGTSNDMVLAEEVFKASKTTLSKRDFYREVENCGYKVVKDYKKRGPYRDKAVIVGIALKNCIEDDDDLEN